MKRIGFTDYDPKYWYYMKLLIDFDQALYYVSQCGKYHYPASTYNDALIHCIIPELIKRFKEAKNIK